MPLAALLVLACPASGPALFLADDDNGPPPGSAYPPPPPLVEGPLPAAGPPRPLVVVEDSGGRLLLSFGGLLGGGIENVIPTSFFDGPVGAVGIGAFLRAGEQFDDRWAFGAEIGGGTSIFASYGRAALPVGYTPADWFTLGVGPAAWVDVTSIRWCPAFGCSASTAEAAGVTLRLDFNGGAERTAHGRHAWTFGVVTDLGATVGENSGGPFGTAFAWAVYLAVGNTYF